MGNANLATPLPSSGDFLRTRWFRRFVSPSASARLFCLPYAGGSAGLYRNWHDWMAPEVEVVAVELPGRGIHQRAAPLDRMEAIVETLLVAMMPLLDLPFALFGHSLGGLIAFELSRALARGGHATPVQLFVSAVEAPHLPSRGATLHDLPQSEFLAELRRFNMGAAQALKNEELAEILLPVLRADFRVAETYRHLGGPPLTHPITVFGGLHDAAIPPDALEAWQRHTRDRCLVRLLAGDHFFIHEYEHVMAASVARCLRGGLSPAASRPLP
jgi:medium-chain acyl-[acyl-carrier-protein] hydrolase